MDNPYHGLIRELHKLGFVVDVDLADDDIRIVQLTRGPLSVQLACARGSWSSRIGAGNTADSRSWQRPHVWRNLVHGENGYRIVSAESESQFIFENIDRLSDYVAAREPETLIEELLEAERQELPREKRSETAGPARHRPAAAGDLTCRRHEGRGEEPAPA